MRKILVTGAGGVLGSSLINNLNDTEFVTYALDLNKDFMMSRILPRQNIVYCDNLDCAEIPFKDIDCIVHCAFARSQNGDALASSIDFSEKVFQKAIENKVKKVINISSQSIYGGYRTSPSLENGPVNPLDCYAIAKYSCEKIGEVLSCNTTTQITNVRLASLVGPLFSERIINKMIKSVKETSKINIVGGKQIFSFLDLRDAVSGLIAMLKNLDSNWQKIYNLGNKECYSIIKLAETITTYVEGQNNGKVEVVIDEKDIVLQIRLDTSLMEKDFLWHAKYSLKDTVQDIYENLYGKN